MKQSEIVSLMENATCIITHKTNPGAHSAMNHVINVATNIARGKPVQDDLIPPVWFEQLRTSNVSIADVDAFKKRRKDAALHIDDLIVWLLDNYRLEIDFLYAEFIFMDLQYSKQHLTEKQINVYNQKVLFIDRDMAL